MADVPDDVSLEVVNEERLSGKWSSLDPREQGATKGIGDEWVAHQRSAILSVPSVVLGERNYVLNPAHPDFLRITFADPVPFHFDNRLFGRLEEVAAGKPGGPRERS